jgi:hypothetical protein
MKNSGAFAAPGENATSDVQGIYMIKRFFRPWLLTELSGPPTSFCHVYELDELGNGNFAAS